jgi:hypothetical protein
MGKLNSACTQPHLGLEQHELHAGFDAQRGHGLVGAPLAAAEQQAVDPGVEVTAVEFARQYLRRLPRRVGRHRGVAITSWGFVKAKA